MLAALCCAATGATAHSVRVHLVAETAHAVSTGAGHDKPVCAGARTFRLSGVLRAPPGLDTVAVKESLNSDQAMSPQGLIGCAVLPPRNCSGWHLTPGAVVLPASWASLRLRT